MIKEYEDNLNTNDCEKNDNRLLKTKDAIKEFPMLTKYTLAKAVADGKLTYIKVGNTNYFRVQDLEDFLESGRKDNNI